MTNPLTTSPRALLQESLKTENIIVLGVVLFLALGLIIELFKMRSQSNVAYYYVLSRINTFVKHREKRYSTPLTDTQFTVLYDKARDLSRRYGACIIYHNKLATLYIDGVAHSSYNNMGEVRRAYRRISRDMDSSELAA
jgi:hypothetical protein